MEAMASYGELISKATPEQRREVAERVFKIIGTAEQNTCCIKDLTARVQARARWQKEYEKLAKVFLEHGAEALSMNFYQIGRDYEGVTVNGKKWTLCAAFLSTLPKARCWASSGETVAEKARSCRRWRAYLPRMRVA